MKLSLKKYDLKQISLSNLYIVSFVVTMLFLLTQKNEILKNTTVFSEASLKELKLRLCGAQQGIVFLILQRVKIIVILFLLSTTSLGNVYVYFNVLWFGISSGLLCTIVLMRYGLKGILLLTAGMFPHYLIYVPAIVLTMQLSREKRMPNGRFAAQFLVIIFVVICGCFLEAYINPDIVAKILKKF